MRLVIDTDVLVAGLRSNQGASHRILLLALDRRMLVLASVPLLLEYEAVATREEHLAKSGLSARETNAVIDALASIAERVELRFLWRPQLKDPNDEMVLETAVNGSADSIATFNVRHLAGPASAFGIRVSRPKDVLGTIKREKGGLIHEEK